MLHAILERHWQSPNPILRLLLRPLAILFGKIAARRRARYLAGSLKSEKLPIPVVIVGNIHAGGTGKTPITAALVAALQARGITVGIISRGYGRSLKTPHVLTANSTAAEAGDEPLLLYRRTHAPTAVASRRVEAARALLAVHPEVQLIIADDGLQHYALARDLEICVFPAADAARHDLDVLPNGGLREPIARLRDVDAVVFSQAAPAVAAAAQQHFRLPQSVALFTSQIHANAPYRYAQPSEKLHSGSLKTHARCVAIAAIARPQRFFDSLAAQGFPIAQTIALPDHAALDIAALPAADYIFVTEKDAAKLPPPPHAPSNIWVLPIDAQITPDLADWVLAELGIQAA
jgi:tetraacyldisaccharide 4'-kinase